MNLRHLAATVVAALAFAGAAAPVAFAQPAVQDCDTARAAYDKALSQLDARAKELGVSDADKDRLRADVEAKGRDGVIDDQESAELLQDPVIQRISTEFRASDLDLIKKVASASNNLLRCDDVDATSAPPTSSTTAPPTSTTAPPASVDNDGDDDGANVDDGDNRGNANDDNVDDKGQPIEDEDSGDAPVGGIETGNGGMSAYLAA